VVGFDEDKDIAVLKIDFSKQEDKDPKEQMRAMRIGSSSDLLVGQRVYAIGAAVLQLEPHVEARPPVTKLRKAAVNAVSSLKLSHSYSYSMPHDFPP